MVSKGWEQDPVDSLSPWHSLPVSHFADCDAARQDDLISAALKDEEDEGGGGLFLHTPVKASSAELSWQVGGIKCWYVQRCCKEI